eukprot:6178169-Pleurochrysis_carterae.AAC.1
MDPIFGALSDPKVRSLELLRELLASRAIVDLGLCEEAREDSLSAAAATAVRSFAYNVAATSVALSGGSGGASCAEVWSECMAR